MRKTTITLFIVLAVAVAPAVVDAAMSNAAGTGGNPLSGVGRQSLLYDQTDNAAGNGAPDQDFEAAYDTYDCEGADDFDVTWADGWFVQQVQTIGTQTTGGTAATANITFYGDSAGFPGAQICTYSGLAVIDVAGALTIDLPTDCFLGTGVAWVAVQAQQDFATAGQHFWSNRITQTLSESVWRNPGGGFAIPACLDWGRQQTVCGVGGAAGRTPRLAGGGVDAAPATVLRGEDLPRFTDRRDHLAQGGGAVVTVGVAAGVLGAVDAVPHLVGAVAPAHLGPVGARVRAKVTVGAALPSVEGCVYDGCVVDRGVINRGVVDGHVGEDSVHGARVYGAVDAGGVYGATDRVVVVVTADKRIDT